MKCRTWVPVVALVTATSAVAVGVAHAEADQPLRLSLEGALDKASEEAPEVIGAKGAVRTAQARRVGAGIVLPINPRVSADVRPSITAGSGFRDLGYGVSLDVLFQPGGAPAARVREADHEAAVAGTDLAVSRAEARVRAFEAYVRVRIAELRIAEARSAMAISQRVVDAVERRVAAGAGSELDHSSAELDLAVLQASEASALRLKESELMELRDALDLDPNVPIELTSAIDDPPSLRDPSYYVEQAKRMHPRLVAIEARMGLIEATEARLRREVFPRVGLYGGLDAAPLSPVFGILGMSIELPVAQRNQGPLAVAARAHEAARTELELEARRLARDVVAAWKAYEGRRGELDLLTKRAMPAAAQTLSFAQAGWEAGRFDLFRLLTATRDAQKLRAARIDVLEATWLARIELERAVGVHTKGTAS